LCAQPIYATLSDVVVYSVRGDRAAARALAGQFKLAVEAKAAERAVRTGVPVDQGVPYTVFVLDAAPNEVQRHLGHLLKRVVDDTEDRHANPTCVLAPTMPNVEGLDTVDETRPLAHPTGLGLSVDTSVAGGRPVLRANTIDFAQREKEEMRELTRASEIFSVPAPAPDGEEALDLSASTTNTHWDPQVGQIFLGHASDVALPADEGTAAAVQLTLSARASLADAVRPGLRAPEVVPEPDEFGFGANDPALGRGWDVCIECHDCAPFPNSSHIRAAEDHLVRLDALWAAKCAREGRTGTVRPPPRPAAILHLPFPSSPPNTSVTVGALAPLVAFLERVLAPVGTTPTSSALGSLHPEGAPAHRTRPLKVLVFSADGYTESSVLALALLMALRGLSLPEAYLALQCEKRRSFFVYNTDLPVLRRVELRCAAQREQRGRVVSAAASALGLRRGSVGAWATPAMPPAPSPTVGGQPSSVGRAGSAMYSPVSASAAGSASQFAPQTLPARRQRASTSPRLPSVFGDHQMWFADPRFDGSFPSRVLPFLYLGNL
jgi:dual specificity MAP kinase phosphatase